MSKRKMNYNMVENKNKMYDVVETATDQVIYTSNEKDARLFMRHLNLGGGFDGWTPSFLLKNFMLPAKKAIPLI